MKRRAFFPSILAGVFLVSGGCVLHSSKAQGADGVAVAMIHPTEGNKAKGIVKFQQMADGVKVTADLEGLTAGAKHAMHVHEFGDCRKSDGSSAGGHYNPEGHAHALPDKSPRHAGDLGNVTADASGKAHYEITVKNISVSKAPNPILGRSVIIHAKEDTGEQPTGNAGGRIGCGVIGVAGPEK